jgi:hypothetical protein
MQSLFRMSFGWVATAAAVAAACGCAGDDEGGGSSAEASHWHALAQDLDGALFSVAGTAANDVWVAGADRGDGRGPTALHWDGASWESMDVGMEEGDLLWVHVFDSDDVYFAGSHGAVLHWDGSGFEAMETPGELFVWGVWGSSPDDLWAVGGETAGSTGFIWRNQGDGWQEVELPDGFPRPGAWFKAWGTAADDVWFCGMDGALVHYDGSDFEEVDAATNRTLLTIHGRPDGSLVTAVGGQFSATLVASREGADWEDVTPDGDAPLQTFGVYHRDDVAYAVGMQTLVLRAEGEGPWQDVDHQLDVYGDLHGVWIDPDGGVWAAGGLVVSPPYLLGTLMYRGDDPPPRFEP